MCNKNCCSLKTALQIRHLKQLVEKQLQEELANPKKIIVTPPSLIYTYEDVKAAADFIIERTGIKPKYGLVCGTFLENMTEAIEDAIVIDYVDIPKFPVCNVLSNKGKLVVGTVMGAPVIAMQGRLHLYEGSELGSCCMPVRVMKLCGVQYLFLTCASSGVNLSYHVGDIVVLKDHINMLGLFGSNPLHGPNDTRFGKRHFSMTNSYDKKFVQKAVETGQEIGFQNNMHTGIYACVGGPVYETAAEQRVLRTIGVDMVGMSLVHEVIVARHCDMKVFAFSLITVPAVEQTNNAGEVHMIEDGQGACTELFKRMVYYIENDLINTPTHGYKLDIGQTAYPDEHFRTELYQRPILNEDLE